MTATSKKKNPPANHQLGQWGERLAIAWLWLKGYHILATRKRFAGVEVDILACHRQTLVLVEVKTRHNASHLPETLTSAKRERLLKAARAVQPLLTVHHAHSIRIDAVLVKPWGLPQHLKNIWGE
ncbi:MAG: YraN family protein [Alphaproteobacteria bacterium]